MIKNCYFTCLDGIFKYCDFMDDQDKTIQKIKKIWLVFGRKVQLAKYWIAIFFFISLVIILLMVVAGRFLPEKSEFKMTFTCNTKADQLKRAIVKVDQYPNWRSDVEKIKIFQNNQDIVSWREEFKKSSLYNKMVVDKTEINLLISSDEMFLFPESNNSKNTIEPGFESRIRYRFIAANGITKVVVTEKAVYKNYFLKILAWILGGRRIQNQMGDFQKKFCQV